MTDSDRAARLSAVSTNFQVAVRRAQELERSGAYVRCGVMMGILVEPWIGLGVVGMGVVIIASHRSLPPPKFTPISLPPATHCRPIEQQPEHGAVRAADAGHGGGLPREQAAPEQRRERERRAAQVDGVEEEAGHVAGAGHARLHRPGGPHRRGALHWRRRARGRHGRERSHLQQPGAGARRQRRGPVLVLGGRRGAHGHALQAAGCVQGLAAPHLCPPGGSSSDALGFVFAM